MASLFSVSKLIGKGRTRSNKRTSSVKYTAQENEASQSQSRIVVDSAPSVPIAAIPTEDGALNANPHTKTMPKEQDFSFPPVPSRKSEVTKIHERKTEAFEEAGYDVVVQPSPKASFGEWTELDGGKKASGLAAKASDAEWDQVGIDNHAKEKQPSANGTNCTSFDDTERSEEPPRKLSVSDWTQLDVEKKAEELSTKPSDAECLQFDIGKKKKEEKGVGVLSIGDNEGFMSETRVKEERAAHMEEMRTVREEKEKLAERVKEVEEELHNVEHELHLKMEQISKFANDYNQKEEEIEALKEENKRILQVAACEREESLDEIRRANEAVAARWLAAKEAKDVETVELMAKQDNMQEELDMVMEGLSESRARVAKLESANQSQGKKLLEQDATLASHTDLIAVLRGQKANLVTQVHLLRTNAQVDQRQNSMLMVQLRQQADDLATWNGTIPSLTKFVRRTTGPSLVEQAVRTIKALNDEIYQTAASLTDCVDEIEKRFVDESDGTASGLETLKSLIGTEIYTELDEESCMTKDEYNPFVLQTGFQACLTACCMRIITSWYPAEPEYGKFLEAIYERIRGLGGADNAAQWRKWTLQSCTFSTNSGTKSVLIDFIIDNLYTMLSMSGWPKLGETANLLDKFGNKISEVVNLAVRLNTLAAETTTPGDLKATTIMAGEDYVSCDMVDDTPEDGWDSTYRDAPYSQVVIGCVGLGLKWREGNMPEAQSVLKPKVILRKEHKLRGWA